MADLLNTELSPARRRFAQLMTRLQHGRIESLHVQNGEPQLEPAPRVILDLKVGNDRTTNIVGPDRVHAVKKHLVELFDEFTRLGTGVIDVIEVRSGLPIRLQYANPHFLTEL
jgi:hypothetical protein